MDELKDYVTLYPSPTSDLPSSANTTFDSNLRSYPQVIKYMGSKAKLLPFIAKSLDEVYVPNRPIVDLFAGACAISGGFGHAAQIISNDIQNYSAIIGSAYLHLVSMTDSADVMSLAESFAKDKLQCLPDGLTHSENCTLDAFNEVEINNQKLLNKEFDFPYHLFTRAYSGTWWSAEQCVWIDSIRQALDVLREGGIFSDADFRVGLTSLMHAMAYTSQGTGHYAQYRDAKTDSSMKDIAKYRRQSVSDYFKRKFTSLATWNKQHVIDRGHKTTSLDYKECLANLSPSVVYADPPYAFVHYSRFYHAIETVVQYDYPVLQFRGGEVVKGRYRAERHQSPFCISTQVSSAFVDLFDGAKNSSSDLLLSYSNTGMIAIEDLVDLAYQELGSRYHIHVNTSDHDHMTMGRRDDRAREVTESLLIAKRR
jgi:adenine-specific DNA-methyltransferase